jgi:SAM-dependent methyltransferase
MTTDAWLSGEAYESFMGRWSRQLADLFLAWLSPKRRSTWLDVGCGTGALTQAVCRNARPRSILGSDPSAEFVSYAARAAADCPAAFAVGTADDLPHRQGGFDFVVSGLVLNFLPRLLHAVKSMNERLRPGGTVAADVWDYAEGMHLLRVFWDEAIALDASAVALDEGRRFPLCRPEALANLFRGAGLTAVATTSLEISMVFPDFAAYWSPLLGGTGPAPVYVASLDAGARSELRGRLQRRLATPDGRIRIPARAFAVRGERGD